MANVPISLAIGPYDHVRDVLDGSVPVAGADLTVLRLPIEEIAHVVVVADRERERKAGHRAP